MAALPHNQKRLSPWTILYTFIALCLLLVLTLFALFWIWNANQAKVVAQLEADIRASGEPVTGADLTQSFPLAKDQEDVTNLWLDGMKALVTPENSAASRKLPYVGVITESEYPKPNAPWPEMPDSENFLKANQFSLDKFHEAARRDGHTKLNTPYSEEEMLSLGYVGSARQAARFLRLELEVKTRQGDARGAAEATRALLCLPRFLEHEPSLTALLIKNVLDGYVGHALAEKLCLVAFTDEELKEFQQVVRSNSPEKTLRMALIGERTYGISLLREPHKLGEAYSGAVPLNGDIVSYLTVMKDFIAVADQGFPGCFDAYGPVEQDLIKKGRSWAARWTWVYTSKLMPKLYEALSFAARDATQLRALEIGIAIELYRRDNGGIPESLDLLAPKYLATLPSDPFTGNALIYEKSENAFTIRSNGPKAGTGSPVSKPEHLVIFFPLPTDAIAPEAQPAKTSP